FRQAVAAYDKAVTLSRPLKNNDRDLGTVLASRATACVELANALTDRKRRLTILELWIHGPHELALSLVESMEQAKCLRDAKASAEEAITKKNRRYPEYAYAVLGNALEDIAMLLRENPTDNYAAAIDAFSTAIKESPHPATHRISRGRAE